MTFSHVGNYFLGDHRANSKNYDSGVSLKAVNDEGAPCPRHQDRSGNHFPKVFDNAEDGVSMAFPRGKQDCDLSFAEP